MFPVWFFILLLLVISYLLYVTRPTEDSIVVLGKNQIRKLQYWFRK
jgi:hypothetical protein